MLLVATCDYHGIMGGWVPNFTVVPIGVSIFNGISRLAIVGETYVSNSEPETLKRKPVTAPPNVLSEQNSN